MPPREQKTSNALAVSQRAGANLVTSMIKIPKTSDRSSKVFRLFLKNIHTSIVPRKEENLIANSTENSVAPGQRDGAEPVLKIVRIAVKPPTTKSKDNEWNELVNWEPNSEKWQGGLRKNKNLPTFVTTEVPYEVWRKHYAKNKHGQYRGTEAPAENCILLPEDEEKWRSPKVDEAIIEPPGSEDATENLEEVKRTVTLTEAEEGDLIPTSSTVQDSAIPVQNEKAIFIEQDGHAVFQAIQEQKDGSSPPVTPASPVMSRSSTMPDFQSLRSLEKAS